MSEKILISKIRTDGGTQMRHFMDLPIVEDYAAAMQDGVQLPPITVFYDGNNYWLADGFHRLKAASNFTTEIECDVKSGSKRDAILFAVGANATHGIRRSVADKRKAVATLLRDEEWSKWSDREIARHCNVDHKTVGAVRQDLSGEIPQTGKRKVQRGGITYQMKERHWGHNNGNAFWTQVHRFNLDKETILEQLQPGAKSVTELNMSKEDCWRRLDQLASEAIAAKFPVDSLVKWHSRFGKVKQVHPTSIRVLELTLNVEQTWNVKDCKPATEKEYEKWKSQTAIPPRQEKQSGWIRRLTPEALMNVSPYLRWFERWRLVKTRFCPNKADDPLLFADLPQLGYVALDDDAKAVVGTISDKSIIEWKLIDIGFVVLLKRVLVDPNVEQSGTYIPALNHLHKAGCVGVLAYREITTEAIEFWESPQQSVEAQTTGAEPEPSQPLEVPSITEKLLQGSLVRVRSGQIGFFRRFGEGSMEWSLN